MILDLQKPVWARRFIRASGQFLSAGQVLAANSSWTMACWFWTDDDTVDQTLLAVHGSGTTSGMGRLAIQGATGTGADRVAVIRDVSAVRCESTAPFTTNRWHHAAGTGASAVYLDGENKATGTSLSIGFSNFTKIGERFSNTDRMSGMILWPAFWTVQLTDSEIKRLALGAHPTTVRPEALTCVVDFAGSDVAEIGYGGSGQIVRFANNGPSAVPAPAFLQSPVIERNWLRAHALAQAGISPYYYHHLRRVAG